MAVVVDMHLHPAGWEEMRPWMFEYRQALLEEDVETFVARYSTRQGMEALLDESGVDFGVILPELSPITTGKISTELVLELCQGSRRLIPFATVNPFLVAQPAREAERLVKQIGCKGIKLYPTYQHFYPNDPMMYPLYARAEALGVPVMFHTGLSLFRGSKLKYGDPMLFDDVAVDFPLLRIVMAHSGRGFWHDRAFYLARLHGNVYMEISGLPPQRLLTYFPDLERNADKIVYGSDWPGTVDVKRNIQAIRELPIREETKDKILGLNAARILGL